MAQTQTLDAFLPSPQTSLDPAWLQVVFETAADEPDVADDEDEDEDDEDEEDEEDEEEEKGEEEDDEDEDEEDEDDDEDKLEVDEAQARTARGQLKRQNGYQRGGRTNG